MNIKRLHLHFWIWLLLFAIVGNVVSKKYGIPLLFLDPEYLGEVNYYSFFWMGGAFAGFFITFNVSSYILYSSHFPFLGGLRKPFTKFILNNSIIPVIFLLFYIFRIIDFQSSFQFKNSLEIFYQILGFLSGIAVFVGLSSVYFYFTNTDIFRLVKLKIHNSQKKTVLKSVKLDNKKQWTSTSLKDSNWRADYYLEYPFKIIKNTGASIYDANTLHRVLDYNQLNAVFVQILALISVLILGFFRDNPYMQIPAAASLFLVFSIMVMIAGAFSFWLKGWQSPILITIILSVNFLTKDNNIGLKSAAYGINYSIKQEYNLFQLNKLFGKDTIEADKKSMINILENWKSKNLRMYPSEVKPKLILIATSGGGLRAALFTMSVLQTYDSLLNKKLFAHTFMLTGASGGLFGASYFRELYLRNISDKKINPYEKAYQNNISKDALNSITLSIAVSDLFVPFQKFKDGKYTYKKDRGFSLEDALNRNLKSVLNKRLIDYYLPEKYAAIPLLYITPTIVNDGKKLIISPQKSSFFCKSIDKDQGTERTDAIDFQRFFKDNNPENLKFLSAIRMNAAFPYITPNSFLPSNPSMEVNDAGVRDNLGGDLQTKFLFNFKEWIEENTSGVIIIQIRDTPQNITELENDAGSIIDKMTRPLTGFIKNWERFMQYNQENQYNYFKNSTNIPCERIVFQYIPKVPENEASLSWHLTSREKLEVNSSIYHPENRKEFNRLKALLN